MTNTNGRRITTDVLYNNASISADIDPFITDISFTDNLSGQSDTISISLGDRERKWSNSWMPKKGASLEASLIISADWGSSNTSKRKLGYFDIYGISVSGPPNKVTVNGTSVLKTSSLKGQKKNRSWEKTNFKKVVTDIAVKNKMKLYFHSQENPTYDRIDQENETDLAFLRRICENNGYSLKIVNKAISIFDDVKLEKEDAVDTIKRTDSRVKDWSGNDTLTDIYKSCKVSYTNPKTKKSISYTFTPPNPPKTDAILFINNEEVATKSKAIQLAKKSLREKNKEETTISLRLAGLSPYYAGQTINLKEFGGFDGKYIITSVNGKVGGGSETSLGLRKCLGGY